VKRALILGITLCGCSLRTPRTTGAAACSSSTQCDHSEVCFLGECRVNASNLSVVRVEVRPPGNSPFGAMQVANIDLRAKVVNDFTLQPQFDAAGTVLQEADSAGVSPTAVVGANVVFTDHAPAIPDRVEQVAIVTDTSGAYSARLPQGTWDVLVRPPAPLPPYRPAPLQTAAPALDLRLPKKSSLVSVDAGVSVSDGGPLPGASVKAIDNAGEPISAPSIAEADGGYSLLLPPGTTTYLLQVGPPADLDAGTPALPLDPLPVYDQLAPGPSGVTISLPPEVKLSGHVLDSADAGIAAASVYARSEGMPWNLARSTTAASDGSYTMVLRAGSYVVEAAPSAAPDAPAVSGEVPITLATDGKLDFVCPPKVRSFGLVVTPNGLSVAASYQVTATRVADKLLTARTAFTTPTGNDGIYHVVADPGTYRFEIVPTPASGLPRKIVQLDLIAAGGQETVLPTIQISRPLSALGTVRGQPASGPAAGLPGAMVSFYSLDAAGTHSVFLGGALTDANGNYKAVVPDVAQPGP
jgi:hypothetical protein